MKKINDIFYSLQGEGYNTGRAAIFIRFAGCNLRCPFCDTSFDTFREMTDEAILEAIAHYPARFVVLTGGEPTLQVDEAFVELLHQHDYVVAMESNGIRPAPKNLDWLTVSPKDWWKGDSGKEKVEGGRRMPDELKIVFDEDMPARLSSVPLLSFLPPSSLLYLQPCDTGNKEHNEEILRKCIAYIEEHPQWRLSLQTHKLAGFK